MIISCKKDKPVNKVTALPYHIIDYTKTAPGCVGDKEACARFKASYPFIDSAGGLISKRINQSISLNLAKVISDEDDPTYFSLDHLANSFFNDYQKYASEDFVIPWELECEGKVLCNTEKIFSLALNSYRFTGGAHPNTYTSLMNFDLKTGRQLDLNNVVEDFSAFKAIAESAFRKSNSIEDGVTLQEAGFFMESFQLSNQFALKPDGLLLFYNTYEIAPYAAGITEFVIPYTQLDGIIKAAFLPN